MTADDAMTMPASATRLRVLVIDNDMRAAGALETLLRAGGHSDVRVAYTGRGALEIVEEFSPAVVLMELDMRDISSYELGQTLRQRAQLQRMRLIAVTDSREHRERDSARNAGFERYLLKPITAGDLATLLASASA